MKLCYRNASLLHSWMSVVVYPQSNHVYAP